MAFTIQVDEKRLLSSLYLWGYFWNPSLTEAANVRDMDDVSRLTIDHKAAKEAIAAWQAFDSNFNALAFILHLRSILADGDIGPVTATMLDAPRCPMPDFPPPKNASFDYGNPDLNLAVQSYQRFAEVYVGGSGSWPKCDPLRKDVHSTRVNLNTANASAKQKSMLKESTALVEKCEAEMGQAVRHIFDGNPEECEHDVRFEYIAGNVIGYAYFPEPDTCEQVVKCRIDNSYDPGPVTFANLLNHEYKGHSDGLDHTSGGIMNPSIITYDPLTWKGDKSEARKRKFFGGVAIPPLTPPPTDPPPGPTPPMDHNGVFIIPGPLTIPAGGHQMFRIKVSTLTKPK